MFGVLRDYLSKNRENWNTSDHTIDDENSLDNTCDKVNEENLKTTSVDANHNEQDQISKETSDALEFFARIKTVAAMAGNVNDVFTLDADDKEYFACIQNPKWQLIIGDIVKVVGEIHDGEFTVVELVPKLRKEVEYGRVTALSIDKGYAVFEESTLVLFNAIKENNFDNFEKLKMHEEYKYEALESDQKFDARTFDYRVLNIIERVESKVSERGIKIKSEPFKITLHPDKGDKEIVISRFIYVRNISDRPVDLMTVNAVALDSDGEGIVELDMTGRSVNYNISKRNGSFRIYFRVHPLKVGLFRFELTADFNDFVETHVFSVEISRSYVVSGPRLRSIPRFDVRLGEYEVPVEMRDIDYTKVNSAVEALSENFPFLSAEIGAENYFDKMRYGIFLEEIALEKEFANFRQENSVFETKDEFLRLNVKNLAEKRPSLVIGDKIYATDPHRKDTERPVFEGVVHKIENESILCKFHDDFHSSHHQKSFSIEFSFSRSMFKRQQYALETVTGDGLGYDFLFPRNVESKPPQVDAIVGDKGELIVSKTPRVWFNNLLNRYQKDAVVNVLRGENRRPLPYIFFGCPGSGKTQTVIETILQVVTHVKSSRILVATPSNSAANLITEMLSKSNGSDLKFIRLVSNNQVEKDLIPEQLFKYCATVSIASEDNSRKCEYSHERFKAKGILASVTKNKILDFRIIIATQNCYGSLLQMKIDPHAKFSHLFIDEAGQSVEPETLIPLALLNKSEGQCILAGDPNQLGPILSSRYGKFFKFNISMLERLLLKHPYYQQIYGPNKNEYDPKFVTKLKINYRALPSLLKVYNDLFYNGELESAVDERHSEEALLMSNADKFLWKYTNKKCSVFFINVDNGRNRKIQDSCSWYNDEEIRAIMSFLQKCRSSEISFKDIGIVTPYTLQVKKIKHQIAVGTSECHTDLKIGTVEEFQGQERLIIIVSTVRTEERYFSIDNKFGLGFLQCPKRINVAISRPKALLVVFGKEAILKKDENWNHLIKYAKENHTYVSDKF